MAFDLVVSSKLAKLQRSGDQNVPHDFTINFPTPIYLDSEKYQAALKNISMSYSWYNIDSAYDNNKIRWRKKKTEKAWKTLTFPNGMYDYANINHFIQKQVGTVAPRVEKSDFIFNMYFDMTVYRVVILIHNDYELDLSQGSFSDLIGYGKETLSEDSVGRKLPDITRGVDWVFIHCDLITRESNNVPKDVIYTFSTAMLRVSYPFEKEPHPVNKKIIDSVRIRVTDGIGSALDLNGIDILVNLMIKQK